MSTHVKGLLVVAAVLAASTALATSTALAQGGPGDVVGSKHDLSVGGGGASRATTETQPCVFCHTPHNSTPARQLWNHASSAATYSTYGSSSYRSGTTAGTFNTFPGTRAPQPSGSAKLCLSCHDGTIAVNATINNGTIAMAGGTFIPATASLGTDLSNDHPVSFARIASTTAVVDPPANDPVRLETDTRLVQCVSCHDPHSQRLDPTVGKFLVKANQGSAVCVTCHRPSGTGWSWTSSSHAVSVKGYTSANTGGVPGLGAHTGYTSVGANACESCHRSHSAPQAQRLLKAVNQRDVCFQCHGNAPVAAKNLATVFAKTYRHPLETSTATILHDATEVRTSATNFSGARRHVDCADCHNAHGAAAGLHTPGTNQVMAGALAGASGVEPASYPAALPLTGSYPMTSAAQSGYTLSAAAAREYQNLLQVPHLLRLRLDAADRAVRRPWNRRGGRVQPQQPQLPPGRRPAAPADAGQQPPRPVEHDDGGDEDVLQRLPRQQRDPWRLGAAGCPRLDQPVHAPLRERHLERHEPDVVGRNRVLLQLSQCGRDAIGEQRAFQGGSSIPALPGVSHGVAARQFPARPHRAGVRPGAVQQRRVAHHGVHAGRLSDRVPEEQLLDAVGLSLTLVLM